MMAIANMKRPLRGSSLCAAIAVSWFALTPAPANAHEDAAWILQQKLKNKVGEWCCGPVDCKAVEQSNVSSTAAGYRLSETGEIVPYSETMPLSVDGRVWVCRRPDGTRRCVFDKPPGS